LSIKEGLRVKQLIQVTCASGRDEIENREIRSLLKASEQLTSEVTINMFPERENFLYNIYPYYLHEKVSVR